MIKAVIFDLDNTLYDYDLCHKLAMEEVGRVGAKMFGLGEAEFVREYEAAKLEVKRHKSGTAAEHNRIFYCQKTVERLGKSPIPAALDLYNAYWDTFLNAMQPYDGASEFLRSLNAAGLKTAVCTDMTAHIQYRKLVRLELDDFIDFMITSEEAGVEKPHPLMFQMSLDKLGVTTKEAVYIGDCFERDVAGALASGIAAVWFVHNRPYAPQANAAVCRSYRDTALWRLCGV